MRTTLAILSLLVLAACGAAEPRAEATYETHTVSADDEMSDTSDADAERGDD